MYIVFEGITGAGKSTQLERLQKFFEKNYPNREVIFVREPGSTPIAKDIRELAQAKHWEDDYMHPLTNAYLYAAARAQLLHTVVIPALQAGKIVISDRSFLSSLAYQGEAQGLGFDRVMSVNRDAIAGILPDVVFYLDVDVGIAMKRVFDAKGDKWETMGRQFFIDTATGYQKCQELDFMQGKFINIDANQYLDDVTILVQKYFKEKLQGQ